MRKGSPISIFTVVVALLSFCSPNQEYKENFQELFEKIDQEDDGEVYLRFDKFFKVRDPNYTPITTLFHYNYNSTFITMPTSEKSLCSGKLFSSYGLSTKMSIRMRRYLRFDLQYLTKLSDKILFPISDKMWFSKLLIKGEEPARPIRHQWGESSSLSTVLCEFKA